CNLRREKVESLNSRRDFRPLQHAAEGRTVELFVFLATAQINTVVRHVIGVLGKACGIPCCVAAAPSFIKALEQSSDCIFLHRLHIARLERTASGSISTFHLSYHLVILPLFAGASIPPNDDRACRQISRAGKPFCSCRDHLLSGHPPC